MEKLIIVGAGGFRREVAWLAEQIHGESLKKVFAVDDRRYLVPEINNIPVCLLEEIQKEKDTHFVIAVGDPKLRHHLASNVSTHGFSATRLIHPRAEISRWVEIGNGSIICAGVIITTNIKIGGHVHINLDCTIGHDVEISDFSTLSPGVHISGNVKIGSNVFIGTGANIINGTNNNPLIIHDNAVIAAGACIIQDVESNTLVAGVPAVKKKLL